MSGYDDYDCIAKYCYGGELTKEFISWWKEMTKPLPMDFDFSGDYPNTPIVDRLPKQVQFNDKKKATTLIFGDKVVVVKARQEDKYDRRIGFLEAYFQATSRMSKTKALKYLNEIVKDKATANKKEKTHLPKEEKK